VFAAPQLNPFMALGPKVWSSTRARISELLRRDHPELRDNEKLRKRALVPMADVKLHLPFRRLRLHRFLFVRRSTPPMSVVMFRGKDNALQPNWLHMPIGYNGRASTVVGQRHAGAPASRAVEAADRRGAEFWALQAARFRARDGRGGRPALGDGRMLTEKQAEEMIFGFVILNDWSARDIQQWEYVPLGPFQAKVFGTSISPWVVTREALEPFRLHGLRRTRKPLPYLQQVQPNNYDMALEVGSARGRR
jgi:fumarylacetoacetase